MQGKSFHVATIILAGGQGTRLYPLTLHHSKPAVSYGGRYRLIDIPISNSINSDFKEIFVIAQYLSSELHHHISQTYRFDHYNPGFIDVLTPQEIENSEKLWFLGTADAVRKNLPTLLKSSAEYYLILSGDQLYNINFQDMIRFAMDTNADLTIASTPVMEEAAKRMGLLKINAKKKVTDFVEKPQEKKVLKQFKRANGSYLASMGIYVFKRQALIQLLENDGNDFGYHLISTAVSKKKTAAYIHEGYWEDIGTVDSYYKANLMLTKGEMGLQTHDEKNPIFTRPTFLPGPKILNTQILHSMICEGCIIEAKEITNSIIGLRSHIKKGTIIRDSIMMGNHLYLPPLLEDKPLEQEASIGKNCLIEKAIIDEHVQIGNNVKLTNKKKHETYDGKGLFVRDGIIIVTAGTKIPQGFEF